MAININEALDRVKNSIYGKDIRQAIVDSVQAAYDDASAAGNANMEVAMARGLHGNLAERLAAVDTNLSNIGSATPKGVYATLTALQTAFPTGATGTYVVTADGKWYYWNGSAWTAGAVYQATTLSEGQVQVSNLDSNLQAVVNSVGFLNTSKVPTVADFSLIVGTTLTTVTGGVQATLASGTYGWAALDPNYTEIEWDFQGAQWFVFGAISNKATAIGMKDNVTGRVIELTPTSYTELIPARSDYATAQAVVGDRIHMKIDNVNKIITVTIKRSGTSSFVPWLTYDMSTYTCTFNTNPRLGMMTMSTNSPKWINMTSVYGSPGTLSDYPTTKSDFYAFKDEFGSKVDSLQTGFDYLYTNPEPVTRDFVNYPYTDGKYWSTVNGVAGYVGLAGYASLNTLVPCNPGDILTLKDWGNMTPSTAMAYGGYTNDNTPYDGSTGRVNWTAGTYDAATNTYSFTIPANCTQIGLSIKYDGSHPKTTGIATIGDAAIDFSDALYTKIEQKVTETVSTMNIETDNSPDYFIKGSAAKKFTKNIGIIAAGQSNIDGRVPVANKPSYITYPITNCNYASGYNGGNTGVFQSGMDLGNGNWAFDLVTYWHLTQTAGKTINVMKYSMGGTSIDPLGDNTYHWTADYEKLSSISNSLLWSFESLIRACIESQGTNFDIRAMLWHQGEGDRAQAANYYKNLKYLIAYCRGIVGNKRLPFITGTISHNSQQYNATIEAAQYQLASEDPYFYLIDMNGAGLLDPYHFNAASSEYFGKMCYDKLIDAGVITATKLNPTRPW